MVILTRNVSDFAMGSIDFQTYLWIQEMNIPWEIWAQYVNGSIKEQGIPRGFMQLKSITMKKIQSDFSKGKPLA